MRTSFSDEYRLKCWRCVNSITFTWIMASESKWSAIKISDIGERWVDTLKCCSLSLFGCISQTSASRKVFTMERCSENVFFAQNDKYNSELIVKSIIIVFMNIDHQENFFHSPEIWRNCQATHVYRVFKYIFSPFDTQCFWVCMIQLFSHVLINGIEKLFSLYTSFVWNCAIRRRRRSWFSRG